MATKAVFALFCDQDKAMARGEEACWRWIHVGFVTLAIESIYIKVVHIVESTFARLRLYDVSIYNMAAFCYDFRIVKRIDFYYNCFFDQLVNWFVIVSQTQTALKFGNSEKRKCLNVFVPTI